MGKFSAICLMKVSKCGEFITSVGYCEEMAMGCVMGVRSSLLFFWFFYKFIETRRKILENSWGIQKNALYMRKIFRGTKKEGSPVKRRKSHLSEQIGIAKTRTKEEITKKRIEKK